MRIFILVSLFNAVIQLSIAQTYQRFDAKKIMENVEFLASDSLKGRKPGTPESYVAAQFIRNQFVSSGLRLLGNNGFQFFDLITNVEAGDDNSLQIGQNSFELYSDFIPFPFSDTKKLNATAVFAGYGLEIKNDTLAWNDYEAFDVQGKWVLLLRGLPAIDGMGNAFGSSASERYKVMVAKDKGAAGVIFINGEKFDKDDELIRMSFDRISSNAGLPVLHVKRHVVERLFTQVNDSISGVEKMISEIGKPVNFWFNETISAKSNVSQKVASTKNVVAIIDGKHPTLKNEFVVIGAHYDHLGYGGSGSGSRVPDTLAIHYGADDNASGVAGVIALAQYFSTTIPSPDRSLVFVAFGAEEMGLIGSKYFVENPLININNIVAMINFDMIGRMRENKVLSIGGTGSSLESEGILLKVGENSGLDLRFSPEGYGPSDHAAFYSNDIPVFFISTGAHEDYHTPNDVASAINAEGMVHVIEYTSRLLEQIASDATRLTFKEAGPKSRQRHGSGYKVTLGLMPDFTDTENKGLKVDAVRPDGPARAGGMLKNDVIVAINGKPVENIYDYMGRLKDLEAGQSITVDVLRNDKIEILIIQL